MAEEAHAAHERAVGHARRGEDDLLARCEVALGVDALGVGDAHRQHALLVAVLGRDEASLHAAVQAAQGRGGEYALGRAADPHEGMHVRAADGRRDAGREVAVADQPDARAGASDVLDQLLVARPVEHDDDQVGHRAVQPLRNRVEILLDRRVEVDRTARGRADDDLLHVAVGCLQEATAGRGRQHRDRTRRAGRAEVRALERIDRDVDLGVLLAAAADVLADVEHRRLVALALADDHFAAHRQGVHLLAHRLDGDMVGVVTLALAHRPRGFDRGRLGHPQEFPRKLVLDHDPVSAGWHAAPWAARDGGRGAGSCTIGQGGTMPVAWMRARA